LFSYWLVDTKFLKTFSQNITLLYFITSKQEYYKKCRERILKCQSEYRNKNKKISQIKRKYYSKPEIKERKRLYDRERYKRLKELKNRGV